MQKNGIFGFCSGSFSKYNVKVRRDCTITSVQAHCSLTFDSDIYKKSIKYKKMRKHEKIRGIKRIKENINKYTKIIPLAHFEEVHYYMY